MSGNQEDNAPHLRVSGVSKAFVSTQALDGVDLEVRRGQIHALLGSNGSGKSTLIKVLAGVYTADQGTLEINGSHHDLTEQTPSDGRRAGLHFVHQETSIFPTLSVAENLVIGRDTGRSPLAPVRRSILHESARATLRRFEIDAEPQMSIQDLRPAARMMVAIARTLQDDEDASSRVLVLDEPTVALEPAEVKMLFEALRRYAAAGQTIVMVTHRLDEVIELADQATVLRDGRNVGSLARVQFTEEKLGELIVGRPLETYFPSRPPVRDETPILEVSNLCGGPVRGVDLSVYDGEILGLLGLVDSGPADLLRLLFGAERIESGRVLVAGEEVTLSSPKDAMRAGLAYVPADRAANGIFPELSVLHNLSAATVNDYRRPIGINRGREHADAARDVERFGIRTAGRGAPVSDLSGGNQQKVIAARWLRRKPRVLLLDDPTQGVDVGARADLWSAIDAEVARGAAVLMTTPDLDELAYSCNRVLVFRAGRVVHEVQSESLNPDDLVELLHTSAAASAA